MIDTIFEQFVEATPGTVMVRGIMERIFQPQALDELFETHAVKQYTRELLFSNVVKCAARWEKVKGKKGKGTPPLNDGAWNKELLKNSRRAFSFLTLVFFSVNEEACIRFLRGSGVKGKG